MNPSIENKELVAVPIARFDFFKPVSPYKPTDISTPDSHTSDGYYWDGCYYYDDGGVWCPEPSAPSNVRPRPSVPQPIPVGPCGGRNQIDCYTPPAVTPKPKKPFLDQLAENTGLSKGALVALGVIGLGLLAVALKKRKG